MQNVYIQYASVELHSEVVVYRLCLAVGLAVLLRIIKHLYLSRSFLKLFIQMELAVKLNNLAAEEMIGGGHKGYFLAN